MMVPAQWALRSMKDIQDLIIKDSLEKRLHKVSLQDSPALHKRHLRSHDLRSIKEWMHNGACRMASTQNGCTTDSPQPAFLHKEAA
ncbi:hypothetical protein DUNSADRAFT_6442 [Dunaliella salina]|uniref:Encoded protein n=1 Tax=Dunaliella salina TaxID=3046 RepID=A0ABQ7H6V8_DUNSA|nr:hypothetical protein DUNSADRAFT_6442 [Dunaliella salina]|eukprot:KAF5842592.1 hypothetical protein DUNSADRAFT_6442 [Dunaliella salina]